ncbi:DNA excision repair protein ERCC-1-like isoform X1 [Dreissena polymorpha]|uniref:DNA excision repair protein ERCC-1 n=1 Tax=Dreissena polymorpha TaxID=45954 RepID=A0A9D4MB05_DREPO|nr:DNA excision repair protein ERCC-1-like isoform X1 [Dreissena polymorpha]KAH3871736.1 hypothetical protein DPMN_034948 [Dreissena polymorpha]
MFKIPSEKVGSGNEADNIKQGSLFQSYKRKKEDPTDKSESVKVSSAPTVAASVLPSKAQTSKTTVPIGFEKPTSSDNNDPPKNQPTEVDDSRDLRQQQGPASTSNTAPSNTILVNFRQRGNPVLKHIRNIPWQYTSIIPDFVMGKTHCALFLSLRYHQLHPDYVHGRLKELGKGYDLRVLLVQVDVKEAHHLLKELAKMCILANVTMLLAFSAEEAGRYLEAYKVYENKPADALMEKTDASIVSKLTECLTVVKSVNKTDAMTLLTAFKSMEGIIKASKEDLSLCAGFGPQKAQRLHDVFHEPFRRSHKTS